jgi:hypothetical protein
MTKFFLFGIFLMYGYTHFVQVDWVDVWIQHILSCTVGTLIVVIFGIVGFQIHQVVLSKQEGMDHLDPTQSENETLVKPPQWDVVLFLGMGVVGIWNSLCFMFSVPMLSFLLLPVACLLLYQNKKAYVVYIKKQFQQIQENKNILICVALWGLISALGPILDTDAVYYHILVPKKMWMYGETFGGFLHPNGSRPLLIPSIDAILYGCGNTSSIAIFRLWMGISLLYSFMKRGGTRLGLFMMLGSASFVQEFGLYGYNLVAAFGVWLCFHLMTQKYNPVIVGLLAGMTLSVKYTSLGPLLVIWILASSFSSSKKSFGLKYRMYSLFPVVAIVLLWPFRNIVEGLHPAFPYGGWSESFQMLEKYGMGREWKDFLLLPYNVLVHAKPYSDQFLGKIHPLWALALPVAIRTKQYRLLGICILCCMFWAMGAHWIRHMIIFLPLCALLFQDIPQKTMKWIWIVYVILLPWQLSSCVVDLEPKIQSVFDRSQFESLQENRVAGWKVAQWTKENTPKDARIAFLYAWTGLATDRFVVLGSVEEHIPTRNWLMTHGESSLKDLQEVGVDFIVVGPPPKYKAGWSFLTKKDFEVRFIQPQKILQNCLLRDTVMIYEHKGFALYRIRN